MLVSSKSSKGSITRSPTANVCIVCSSAYLRMSAATAELRQQQPSEHIKTHIHALQPITSRFTGRAPDCTSCMQQRKGSHGVLAWRVAIHEIEWNTIFSADIHVNYTVDVKSQHITSPSRHSARRQGTNREPSCASCNNERGHMHGV